MKRQQKKVRMTYHALDRLDSRSGRSPRKMRSKIARRLLAMLRAGVIPDKHLGVKVPADDGLVAICTPDWAGGWDIVTVRPDNWNDNATGEVEVAATNEGGDAD